MQRLRSILIGVMLVLAGSVAHSESRDPRVVSGSASFQKDGANWTITQSTHRVAIDWQQFDVPAGSTTRFIQPSSSAVALNRIIGPQMSMIDGSLIANGQVWIINPNGISIGPSANIDIGGFVASTLDVSNAQFVLGGDISFVGDSPATIKNEGRIDAIGGNVYLIARHVDNSGTISATGSVGLVAGSDVVLTQDHEIYVRPTTLATSPTGTGIANSGIIEAVSAKLEADGNMYALAINNTGLVRATGTATEGGRVVLRSDTGKVSTSGTLAANRGQAGGEVLIYAGELDLAGTINVAGIGGAPGYVLLDPHTLDIDADAAAAILTSLLTGNVDVTAYDTINVNSEIDSDQSNFNTLSFLDENSDGDLTINLWAKVMLGTNQTLVGEGTRVNVFIDPGTLKAPLALVASGGTIKLPSFTCPWPVTLNQDVTIFGAGIDSTIFDGQAKYRPFIVNFCTVTLEGMTIRNGKPTTTAGGGIFNRGGNLTLRNVKIENCYGGDGGGICAVGGTTTIINSTIINNEATRYGGGIHNSSGPMTITGCTISGNVAGTQGGGIQDYTRATAMLTVRNTQINDNTAGVRGGGIFVAEAPVLENVSLSGNTAPVGRGICYSEGGLAPWGPLNITSTEDIMLDEIWANRAVNISFGTDGGNVSANFVGFTTDQPVTINAGAGNNWIILDGGVTGGGTLTVNCGGGNDEVIAGSMAATAAGLTINGGDGNDTMIVDFAGGGPAGLIFNGDAGSDSMMLFDGGPFSTVTHSFTNASDGSVDVDGTTITYTGLEPIADNLSAADRVFTFSNASQTITLGDDGIAGNGTSKVDSTLAESVTFTNPTNSLTVNAGTGDDQITVNSLDSMFGASVAINSGDGADAVEVGGLLADTAYTFQTGAGSDVVNVNSAIDTSGTASTKTISFLDGDSDLTANFNQPITLHSNQMLTGQATAVNVTAPGLIQNGVDAAVPGVTVNVAAGTYTGPVTIAKDLTIAGAGEGSTFVDGQNSHRPFTISSGAVALSDMTIQNGSAADGGGIHNAGTLTITDSTVSGNTATAYGGGIANDGGTLSLTRTTVSGNTAGSAGHGIYYRSSVLTPLGLNSTEGITLDQVDSNQPVDINFGMVGGIADGTFAGFVTDKAVTITGGAGNNTITLNGGVTGGGTLTVNGGPGNDALVVDFTGGTIGPAGLTFNGGVGSDSLTLQGGGTFTAVTHTFTNGSDGSVAAGYATINYTGLEPITDLLLTQDRKFIFPAVGGNVITVADDGVPGDGISVISSNASETVTFRNPVGGSPGSRLVIVAAPGDTVTAIPDALGDAGLWVESPGDLTIGDIAGGQGPAGFALIMVDGQLTQQAGTTVTGTLLVLDGAGNFDTAGGPPLNTAVNNLVTGTGLTGRLRLLNTGDLNIGLSPVYAAIQPPMGVTAPGGFSLTNTGDVTVSEPVASQDTPVTIRSFGRLVVNSAINGGLGLGGVVTTSGDVVLNAQVTAGASDVVLIGRPFPPVFRDPGLGNGGGDFDTSERTGRLFGHLDDARHVTVIQERDRRVRRMSRMAATMVDVTWYLNAVLNQGATTTYYQP